MKHFGHRREGNPPERERFAAVDPQAQPPASGHVEMTLHCHLDSGRVYISVESVCELLRIVLPPQRADTIEALVRREAERGRLSIEGRR